MKFDCLRTLPQLISNYSSVWFIPYEQEVVLVGFFLSFPPPTAFLSIFLAFSVGFSLFWRGFYSL